MSSALGCADDVEQTPTTSSDVTSGCTLVRAGAAWSNQAFPVESGVFHVEFSATPSATNIDAVVGLSSGAASNWTKLAAIVRFAPNGVVDVRRGSAYSADASLPYAAGETYRFRIDVDVKRHVYSVYTLQDGRAVTTLAKDYPFRTEQASVTSLNNIAMYLEPSRPGSLNVCDVRVVRDDSFGDNCLTSVAGGTFRNIQLTPTTGVLMTNFNATPTAANMDGVIGFGLGAIDAWNDFAVSIRFATNGMIEARDGDVYRADHAYAYRPGIRYRFRAIIDLPSKTYSIMVAQEPSAEFVEIARSYKFRSQQANITGLDHAATIVASSTGRVDACALTNASWKGLQFARRGTAGVVPLHNNNLAVVDQTGTVITNANGVTLYRGAPSGWVAHDGNDNIYVATIDAGWLKVESFSPTLARRFTRTFQVDGEPHAMNVWTDGTIVIAMDTHTLVMLHPDGSAASINIGQFSPAAVAISRSGFGLVNIFPDGMQVESYSTTGQRLWQRFWSGSFLVEYFVPHGQGFALTGQFNSTVDFGQGPMEPYYNPETSQNTFLLSLTANGVVRFSKRLWASHSTGLATDNNTHIAVAAQTWTQTPYMDFAVYDSSGNPLFGLGGERIGIAGGISVSPSGRAFVNLMPKTSPSGLEPLWPHVFAFDAR